MRLLQDKVCIVTGAAGSILMTSSVVGVTSDPGICAYATSKHAVIGLVRSVAKEAAPRRGNRPRRAVSCRRPDWTATAGDFVYETPGERHTQVAYEHKDPMKVFFIVTGPLVWLDEKGGEAGYFDVHNYIAMCRAHYETVEAGDLKTIVGV